MGRITVSEVKARIASILAIETPKEFGRLKEFLACGTSMSVGEAKACLAAAAHDATKAPAKAQAHTDKHSIPGLPKAPAGLSDSQRGAADALAASRLGFGEDPEIAKRNAERMKNIYNAGVTMVL
jgi:hypothetical protein